MTTPRVDSLEILLSVFSEEQLMLFAKLVAEAKQRAMERRCVIECKVEFNDKGYPRYWTVGDSGRFPEF